MGALRASWDIWALPLEGDRKPSSVIATPFNESAAALSPDGRWIAYQSDESGDLQVYVQPFPPTGARVRVSTTTGVAPEWSADGRQLYFHTNSVPKHLLVADVSAPLRPGVPKELFSHTGNLPVRVLGARILLNAPSEQVNADAAPVTVVLNFTATLKR